MPLIDFDYVVTYSHGPIEKAELNFLAGYAKKVPDNGTIIDIGTNGGRSAFIMAIVSKPTVKIFTIDPNPAYEFFKLRELFKLNKRITILIEKSQDLYQNWKRPIDLLFVDGDHSYKAVKEDVEGWAPLVKKEGYCLFHDYHKNAQIKPAVDEAEGRLLKKVAIFEITYAGKR